MDPLQSLGPLCCLELPNCGVWGVSLQGQHVPVLHPHCRALAAAARAPLGAVSLHCWCQQHWPLSGVNGSEREQMDFLGLMAQPLRAGFGWEPGIAALHTEAAVDEFLHLCLQPVNFLQAVCLFFWFFFPFLFADTGSVDLEWSLQGVNKRWLIAY